MNVIRIGIIGTDTSHAIAFTQLVNDINNPHYIAGGKVIAAYPGGSPDFPLSITRVEGFMEKLSSQYGISKMDTPEEVAACCEVILLESADGRVHLEQFRRIASFGKPVFIDKPLALSYKDALAIQSISEQWQTPIMSCSALRYAEQLIANLDHKGRARVTGTDVYGPLIVEPTQSYYFWYGIHSIEMLYAILGPGCVHVSVTKHADHDLITGEWKDGRIGTIRCNRTGNSDFGATIHRDLESSQVDIQAGIKPFYASLMEQIMAFFATGLSPVDWNETLEIISFLEAAEKSRVQETIIQLEGK